MDNSDRNILDELNEGQRQAVTYMDGPELVIAGAGSGKTRVLTYKIAYMMKHEIQPDRILALTFTNKAAREMRERIESMVGWADAKRLWMGTFHSVFGRILRRNADRIGFTPQFTIYDTSDSKNIIRNIIKLQQLDDKKYKIGRVMSRISLAKNNLITAKAYYHSTMMSDDNAFGMPKVADIYFEYAKRCKESNAMDFDDMLLFMNILLRDNPDVLQELQHHFRYILVDEYQDTNFSQTLIINKLAMAHQHLCVVGDDAQSIYSFRGANISNILSFQKEHQGCQLFKLEENYRSTQTIVNAANSLIDKNIRQIRKTVFSNNEVGSKIKVTSTYSDLEEAEVVSNQITNTHSTGAEYQDIAILYRTNAQSRVLEEALRKKVIPYKIFGGLSFYQRKEVKDALAYVRLVINELDEEALLRIINYPARGIGDTTIKKVIVKARDLGITAWDVVSDPEGTKLDVNKGTVKKLTDFASMINRLKDVAYSLNANEVINDIIETSGLILDAERESTQEGITRKENLEELKSAVNEYCTKHKEETEEEAKIEDFMSEVALVTDQDKNEVENKNVVTMMTVHAAKGLEFDHVFIVGLEEQLFPSIMAEEAEDIEEERRLMYVAMTRAKKTCHISYARSRWRNGQSNLSNKSRFIDDIDPQYLILPIEETQEVSFEAKWNAQDAANAASLPFANDGLNRGYRNKYTVHPIAPVRQNTDGMKKINVRPKTASATISATQTPEGIKAGTILEHDIFGGGVVTAIEDIGGDWRISVNFSSSGTKNLLLKYAKGKIKIKD